MWTVSFRRYRQPLSEAAAPVNTSLIPVPGGDVTIGRFRVDLRTVTYHSTALKSERRIYVWTPGL